MTREKMKDLYFDWMYSIVCPSKRYYHKLLKRLNEIEFVYTISMDGNRAEDGVNLRYRFGRENGFQDNMIAPLLDDDPCTILEMMVALAIRCEEHIMSDDVYGDRTEKWFWDMIYSLHLDDMDDFFYSEDRVDHVCDNLIEHKYQRNGDGGLFTVKRYSHDMRCTEIWYQMCWYLNELS